MQVRVPHIPRRAKHQSVQHRALHPLLPFNLVSLLGFLVRVPAPPFPAASCFRPTPVPSRVGRGRFGDPPLLGGGVWI